MAEIKVWSHGSIFLAIVTSSYSFPVLSSTPTATKIPKILKIKIKFCSLRYQDCSTDLPTLKRLKTWDPYVYPGLFVVNRNVFYILEHSEKKLLVRQCLRLKRQISNTNSNISSWFQIHQSDKGFEIKEILLVLNYW